MALYKCDYYYCYYYNVCGLFRLYDFTFVTLAADFQPVCSSRISTLRHVDLMCSTSHCCNAPLGAWIDQPAGVGNWNRNCTLPPKTEPKTTENKKKPQNCKNTKFMHQHFWCYCDNIVTIPYWIEEWLLGVMFIFHLLLVVMPGQSSLCRLGIAFFFGYWVYIGY